MNREKDSKTEKNAEMMLDWGRRRGCVRRNKERKIWRRQAVVDEHRRKDRHGSGEEVGCS